MERLAMKLYYEGSVQGVGFRATVRWIAEGFEILGWVKNLADGRVELFAQGDTNEVKEFLRAIRESELAGHIKTVVEEKAVVVTGMRGFSIT